MTTYTITIDWSWLYAAMTFVWNVGGGLACLTACLLPVWLLWCVVSEWLWPSPPQPNVLQMLLLPWVVLLDRDRK